MYVAYIQTYKLYNVNFYIVTSSWDSHVNSVDKLPDIDYIKLNKEGCKNKMTNSRVNTHIT